MEYLLPKVYRKTCYLQTIKLVKETLHLNLKEAKDMVDEGIIKGEEVDVMAFEAALWNIA